MNMRVCTGPNQSQTNQAMGYSRKNPNRGGGLRTYFFEKTSGIFRFVTLSLEIPDKTKLHPWKFHKTVLHPLKIPRPKTKTHGESTLFFLYHPWKCHFFLNWPLEFLDSIFSIPLKVPCPQPHPPPPPTLFGFLGGISQ